MAGRPGRRGWGRIRQLKHTKGRRYQASYVWPPMTTARHNALTTFSTRALAERWLASERQLIERGEWSAPKDRLHREVVRAQTFGDYAQRWVAQRELKPRSRAEYQRLYAKYVAEPLGAIPLRSLDAAAVRGWYAGLGCSTGEKFKLYRHLHSICTTAVADGLLSPNPCQLNLKAPDRQVDPVILDPAEVAAAADVIAPQYRALVLIGEWCGLRYGELGELRRKDISNNCEIITVARTFNHEGGCHIGTPKSGKVRTVVVPPHIRADVKHHLDTFVADDPEALLLAGRYCKCGHLSDSTFRALWH